MARKPTINTQQLLLLYGQPGMTHDEIAKQFGVSRVAVTRAINKLKKDQPELFNTMSVETFREEEPDRLASLRMTIFKIVEEKLKQVTLNDVGIGNIQQFVNTIGMLIEKERLLRGQSTDNKAHIHVHAHKNLDADTKRQMLEYIEALTLKQLEKSRAESIEE